MRTAWLPALGLLVLAPVCAEYLWGYDDSTGHPATLIGNLVVFSPLYVDQSMWSTGYRDIPYWEAMSVPTYIAPIGLSLHLALSFVGGHVILSIGSPIAMVETLTPGRRHELWLGPVVVWVVLVLVVSAFVVGAGASRSRRETCRDPCWCGRRPFAMIGWVAIPPTRIGTALVALLALGVVVIVRRYSHRDAWDQRHVLALASAAVIAAGSHTFLTTPIGDVSNTQKYGHNIALLVVVGMLSLVAVRSAATPGRPGRGGGRPASGAGPASS